LPRDVLLDGDDNAGTTFRGHRPLKIWECKKRAKFITFNDNFRLWAQISLNCIGISPSGKRRYQIQLIPRWIKKIELQSTNIRDYAANVYPPKSNFSEGHISAPKGCCAPKFLHVLENDHVLLAHPPPGAGAPLTTFFKGESKIGLKCNKGALITSELGSVARRNFGTWRASRLGC